MTDGTMKGIAGIGLAAVLALTASAAWATEAHWQQYENWTGCHVWNAAPEPGDTVTWTGDCVNGRAEGPGTQTWRWVNKYGTWEQESYTGTMHDGKYHGRGVTVWANDDRYEGEYRDGWFHGRGIYMFADADACEGEWREDRLVGTGVGMHEGDYVDCYMDGDGTITWMD